MSNNALWWVTWTDALTGHTGTLSLSSPDLANPAQAHGRAKATAKTRLAKKGVKAINLNSQCVG